jgi:hypothetical protein
MPSIRLIRSLLSLGVACHITTGLAFAEKHPTDVTAKVSVAVKDESISIPASNEMFGDTAPFVPKKLSVEYLAGDDKHPNFSK